MSQRRSSVTGATPKVINFFPIPEIPLSGALGSVSPHNSAEVHTGYDNQFTHPNPLPNATPQLQRRLEVRKIFDSIDIDGGGTVTISEFEQGEEIKH